MEKDVKEVERGIDLIIAPQARSEKLQKLSTKTQKKEKEKMEF